MVSILGKLTRHWGQGDRYARHRGEALRLAQEEMDGGTPRQEICDLLLRRAPQGRQRQAYAEVVGQLHGVMLDRNSRAALFEKRGEIERAVELYEANVADRFEGGQPYERLLEIYAGRADWRNALRVAEAYRRTLADTPAADGRRAVLERRLAEWEERLQREARER